MGLLVVVALGEGRAAVDASNEHLQAALLDLLQDIDATRRGVERDLHDGAQQHLAALAMQLHVAEQLAAQAAAGDAAVRRRLGVVLERVAGQVEQAREELALLVEGRFGETLREIGLGEALRRSAALARGPVRVTADGAADVPAAAAMTAYFVCNEAVQNATKHAGPDAAVTIDLRLVTGPQGDRLTFRVSDDGQGCAPAVLHAGRGVGELVRRVREAGGDLDDDLGPGARDDAHRLGAGRGHGARGHHGWVTTPRLRRLLPADLDPAQRAVHDAVAGGRRAQGPQAFGLVDDDGALAGPFNAFLLQPRLGLPLQALGVAVRYGTALPDRAREIAILVVATVHGSAFERAAHEAVGRAAGLTAAELDAVRDSRFDLFDTGERLVARTAHTLATAGDLDDDGYARAVAGLGEAGLFELLTLVGYYAMLALQLRVFRVDPPAERTRPAPGHAGPA